MHRLRLHIILFLIFSGAFLFGINDNVRAQNCTDVRECGSGCPAGYQCQSESICKDDSCGGCAAGTITREKCVQNQPAPTSIPPTSRPLPTATPILQPTAIPIAISRPPSVSLKCINDNSIEVTWLADPGADFYALRLLDHQNPNGDLCSQNPGVSCIENVRALSQTYRVDPGHTYRFWIHSRKGDQWGVPVIKEALTCGNIQVRGNESIVSGTNILTNNQRKPVTGYQDGDYDKWTWVPYVENLPAGQLISDYIIPKMRTNANGGANAEPGIVAIRDFPASGGGCWVYRTQNNANISPLKKYAIGATILTNRNSLVGIGLEPNSPQGAYLDKNNRLVWANAKQDNAWHEITFSNIQFPSSPPSVVGYKFCMWGGASAPIKAGNYAYIHSGHAYFAEGYEVSSQTVINGTPNSTLGNITQSSNFRTLSNDKVVFQITPANGYIFNRWVEKDATSIQSTQNPYTVPTATMQATKRDITMNAEMRYPIGTPQVWYTEGSLGSFSTGVQSARIDMFVPGGRCSSSIYDQLTAFDASGRSLGALKSRSRQTIYNSPKESCFEGIWGTNPYGAYYRFWGTKGYFCSDSGLSMPFTVSYPGASARSNGLDLCSTLSVDKSPIIQDQSAKFTMNIDSQIANGACSRSNPNTSNYRLSSLNTSVSPARWEESKSARFSVSGNTIIAEDTMTTFGTRDYRISCYDTVTTPSTIRTSSSRVQLVVDPLPGPWVNQNYNTTKVFGQVLEKTANGSSYWAANATVCPGQTSATPVSSSMNVNGFKLDTCKDYTTPYFERTISLPVNYTHTLAELPAGYECVGWTHYFRTIDGKSWAKQGEGTGCSTGPRSMAVMLPASGYHNSHYFEFEIRKIPTGNLVTTITAVDSSTAAPAGAGVEFVRKAAGATTAPTSGWATASETQALVPGDYWVRLKNLDRYDESLRQGNADVTSVTITAGQNVTLTGRYTRTYVVAYLGNGSTEGTVPANQKKIYGQSLNLAANSGNLIKTNHTFSGWNTNAAGTGTSYAEGGAYTANTDVTLYAKWTASTSTVTLDKQGGTNGTGTVTATYGSNMPAATTPSRTGYAFGGYYDAAIGGTQYYTSAMASARTWDKIGASTLYARWTARTYTVSFNLNYTGSPDVAAKTVTYDETYGVLPSPSRNGYRFDGWYTTAQTGGSAITNGTTVSITQNQTLYARWTPNIYTISTSVSPQGGGTVTLNPANGQVTHGGTITLTASAASGYEFQGWKEGATSRGTSNPLTLSPIESDRSITAEFVRLTGSLTVTTTGTTGQWQYRKGSTRSWSAAQASGTTINDLAVGNDYQVQFTSVDGYDTPATQTGVTITTGQNTPIAGAYVRQTGSLKVNLTPSSGKWRRTGTATWRDAGSTENNIPTGTYTIEFSDVPNYAKPQNLSGVVIEKSQTRVLSQVYTQQMGSLSVTIAGPSEGKWQYRKGNDAWSQELSSGTTVNNLILGNDYEVQYSTVNGYDKPTNQTGISISYNQTTNLTGSYTRQTGRVTVNLGANPPAGAGWQYKPVGSNTWTVGDANTVLPTGNYNIALIDLNDYTEELKNSQGDVVQPTTVITVTKNGNVNLTGTYTLIPDATPTATIAPVDPTATNTPIPEAPTATNTPLPDPEANCPGFSRGNASCDFDLAADGTTKIPKIDQVDYQCWKRFYEIQLRPNAGLASPEVCTQGADFNNDSRLNLLDFAIWFKNAF